MPMYEHVVFGLYRKSPLPNEQPIGTENLSPFESQCGILLQSNKQEKLLKTNNPVGIGKYATPGCTSHVTLALTCP